MNDRGNGKRTTNSTGVSYLSDNPTIRYVTMLELLIQHTGSIPVIVLIFCYPLLLLLMSCIYVLMKRTYMQVNFYTRHRAEILRFRMWFILLCLSRVDASTYICEYCEADTFCYQDLSTTCPTSSSSPSGSTSLSDCLCDPGFYPLFDESSHLVNCDLCLSDHWCPGNSEMYPCIHNSKSATGAFSPLQCICDPGFFGLGNASCVACAAGTYKTQESVICIQCPVDTYNFQEAGDDPSVCVNCPLLSCHDLLTTLLTDGQSPAGPNETGGKANPPKTKRQVDRNLGLKSAHIFYKIL